MSAFRPGIGRKVITQLPLAGGGTAPVAGIVVGHLARDLHVELERSDKSRFVMTLPPSEVVEMLTPSEVALAKVLAAMDTTPEGAWAPKQPHMVLSDIATALGVHGYMYNGIGRVRNGLLTPAARTLLDRARKAGVL